MWQSVYVPVVFSPDWALVWWCAGAFGLLLLERSRYRGAAPSLYAGFWLLIAGQCLFTMVCLSVGGWQRSHRASPNDVYVAGGVGWLLSWLAALTAAGWVLRRTAPLPALALPEDSECSKTLLAVLVVGSVVFPVSVVGFAPLWVLLPVYLLVMEASLPSWGVQVSCAAGLALASYAWWLGKRWHPERLTRIALVTCGVVLGLFASASLGLRALLPPAPEALTDRALFESVVDNVFSQKRCEASLGELRARPRARWSGLEQALRDMRREWPRSSPSEERAEYRSLHPVRPRAPGDFVFSHSYEGEPERELLRIAISRGELGEPRAWRDDAGLPVTLRERVAADLAGAQ